jgi:hypothetical protein
VEVALDSIAPKTLVVTLRTLPGFDPEDYSLYNQYQHENFIFTFKSTSTVKERVLISEPLIAQIDAKLNAAMEGDDVDGSAELSSQRQFIRNERGRIVVTGNFVDLNSDYIVRNGLMLDAGQPWMWKGRRLNVDWAYYPSNWAGRLKQAGEASAVKVEE